MRKLSCLIVLACFLVTFSGTALAWNNSSEGRPYQDRAFGVPTLSIWHDRNDEFHVRSTSLRGRHIITGTIHTNGRFYDVDEKNMEGGDYIRLDRARNSISFRFTDRGFDEFNFKVRNGNILKFDVNRDGRDMPGNHIFIGKNGWHPRDNTFTLR